MLYLTECYKRCHKLKTTGSFKGIQKSVSSVTDELISDASTQIIQNLSTVFKEPEIMGGDGDPNEQLFGFFNDANNDISVVGNLLEDLCISLQEDGYKTVADQLSHYILNIVKNEALSETLFGMGSLGYSRLETFVQHPNLAKQFILYNYPKDVSKSTGYAHTLLGILLSKSCLPNNELGAFDFFENPSSQPASVHQRTEGQIWQALF